MSLHGDHSSSETTDVNLRMGRVLGQVREIDFSTGGRVEI
jgi:hypothetical protein